MDRAFRVDSRQPPDGYILRPWRQGDEEQLLELFSLVFGKEFAEEEALDLWHHLHTERPWAGPEILVAEREGKIAASYEVGAVPFVIDGIQRVAALSYATMTHPQHRRRGLFVRLANTLYEDLAARGYAFTYGFPNQNSAHGFFRNLGWFDLGPPPVAVRPTLPLSWLHRRVSGERKLRGISADISVAALQHGSDIPRQVDELAEAALRTCRVKLQRDREYLVWRYLERRANPYHVVAVWRGAALRGLAITRRMEFAQTSLGQLNALFLCEFLADPGSRAGAMLVRAVVRQAAAEGCVGVTAMAGPCRTWRRFFLRHGFIPVPRLLFPHPLYFGVKVHDQSLRSLLANRENWYLSWGDHDVV